MMDLHRCRFVPFPPSAINAVAVPYQEHATQCTKPHARDTRVAIGRANGDIEIWNPADGAWVQESVMYGGKDRSVEGLVWLSEPNRLRLFSIGLAATVTEWDLEKGRPKRHASGQHGEIWCIAAQPQPHAGSAPGPPKLVAGTIDGELVMYNLEDGDLQFERKCMTTSKNKRTNIVSIAFLTPFIVVAGCSDSSIRVCDIRRGIVLRKMSLGTDAVAGSKDIIVWAIKALPEGSGFVTGDSTGHVCIWDSKTYTLVQKLQAHDQDVLSLAVSLDGCSVMSGGMDKRAVMMKRSSPRDRFGKHWGRRYHEHDVKALASLETAKGLSVVIAGGPDAAPVVIPLKEHGKELHRSLSHLPQSVPVTSAAKARFVAGWWGREIHLWQLRQTFGSLIDADDETEALDKNHKLLKTIVVKGESSIASVAINSTGSLLVVATTSEVKAFHLLHDKPAKSSDIEVTQVPVPDKISRAGATAVQISPTDDTLCLIQDRFRIVTAKIGERVGDDGVTRPALASVQTLRRKLRVNSHDTRPAPLPALGRYERGIKHVAFSHSGKMLAVADLAGYVDTWISREPKDVAQNGEGEAAEHNDASSSGSDSSDSETEASDASSPRWSPNPAKQLPKLVEPPVTLSFTNTVPEADEDTLLVMAADWHIALFQPRQGVFAPWSRRNPHSRLPLQLAGTRDVVKGLVWQGSRAWFYGVSYVGMVDFSRDLPGGQDAKTKGGHGSGHADSRLQGTKRKRNEKDSGAGARMQEGDLAPKKVQRLDLANGQQWKDIGAEAAPETTTNVDSEEESDADDDQDEESNELALSRGRHGRGGSRKKSWWITYRYRPILGIVPLGDASAAGAGAGVGKSTLEAALVERPAWDTDIGVRFVGPEDRDRP